MKRKLLEKVWKALKGKKFSPFFSKIEGKLGQRVARRPRAGSRDIDARRHSERLVAVSMMFNFVSKFDDIDSLLYYYLMNFI